MAERAAQLGGTSRGLRSAPRFAARLGMLLAVVLIVLGSPARAEERVGINVSFGWQGVLVPDRWCPMRAILAGPGGAPLSKPLGGTLVVRYAQDATQEAELRLAVAGTPGRTARLDGAVCVPRFVQRITCELYSEDGDMIARQVYANGPDDDAGELPLPPVAGTGCMMAITDGSQMLDDDLLKQWRRQENVYSSGTQVSCASLRPGEFPVMSAAYQSVRVAVIDGNGEIDPRAAAALREWVLGGGRLVVVAARGGDGWRAWVRAAEGGTLVEAAEPSAGVLPESVQRAAQTKLLLMKPEEEGEAPGLYRAPRRRAREEGPAEPVRLSALASQRVLSLTPAGRAHGWSVRWALDGAGDADAGARGLLAEGPVGLGHVVVMGLDPRRSMMVPEGAASSADKLASRLWRDALDKALADELRADVERDEWAYDYMVSSGGSLESSQALRGVLDASIDVAPLSIGVFMVIGVSMLLLAVMIGPGDFLLLRSRHRRQWSWVTAFAWIGLASAASYFGPALIRDSRSSLRRVSVVDAVTSLDGRAPALAYQTSVTSIWAGATRRLSIGASPNGAELSTGASWRGVSGVERAWHHESAMLLPISGFEQRPPSIDASSDPWGGVPARLSAETAPERAGLALRGWTLRAFLDEARVPCPVFATFVNGAAGRVVRLGGVPAGASVAAACVETDAGWTPLAFQEEAAEAGSGDSTAEAAMTRARSFEASIGARFTRRGAPRRPAPSDESARVTPPGSAPEVLPWDLWLGGSGGALPGADRRSAALAGRVSSGEWAVLYLHLRDLPMDVAVETGIESKREALVRLAVPMEAQR
ncbi:MAG: hypothetical protein AB7K52_11680 [Phycisphaerales bacterium]